VTLNEREMQEPYNLGCAVFPLIFFLLFWIRRSSNS